MMQIKCSFVGFCRLQALSGTLVAHGIGLEGEAIYGEQVKLLEDLFIG